MSTNHLDIVNDIFIVLARLWSNQVRMQECGNVYILVTRHLFKSQTKIDTHDNLYLQNHFSLLVYPNNAISLLYCYIRFLPIKQLWTLKQYYILIYCRLQRKSLHNIVSEVCVSTVFIVNLTILFLVIFKLLTHEIHVKGHAIVHRVINPTFQLCVIRLQGQVIQQNSENANYIKSYNKVL